MRLSVLEQALFPLSLLIEPRIQQSENRTFYNFGFEIPFALRMLVIGHIASNKRVSGVLLLVWVVLGITFCSLILCLSKRFSCWMFVSPSSFI